VFGFYSFFKVFHNRALPTWPFPLDAHDCFEMNKFYQKFRNFIFVVIEDLTDGDAEINPVITLTVRAYDDGIPSLDAEVPVHIFTEDVSSRMMRFIVSQDPESVGENQDQVTKKMSWCIISFLYVH
jgi:hypothetical protein